MDSLSCFYDGPAGALPKRMSRRKRPFEYSLVVTDFDQLTGIMTLYRETKSAVL